jgi:hypothetical protein
MSCGGESWTLIGPDSRPLGDIDELWGSLTRVERSPNPIEAYARDLKAFCSFRDERALAGDSVDGGALAGDSVDGGALAGDSVDGGARAAGARRSAHGVLAAYAADLIPCPPYDALNRRIRGTALQDDDVVILDGI